MEKIIESNKEQDTYDLGYELGQHAKPGQVFTLVGDLGVGKTVFTKGLAAGLGITEPVSSPTFTIVQVYEEGRLHYVEHYSLKQGIRVLSTQSLCPAPNRRVAFWHSAWYCGLSAPWRAQERLCHPDIETSPCTQRC